MALFSCILLMFLVTNLSTRNGVGPWKSFARFSSVVVFPSIAGIFAISEISNNSLMALLYALLGAALLINGLFVTKIIKIGNH